ncbi:hypothetical protein M405DRAFT_810059 [Rhizopogon salebrosus TDB-379]|nr:hypothetical protein M405DRAFT_810059 [Rhizopogon salebrosus TDB-379]
MQAHHIIFGYLEVKPHAEACDFFPRVCQVPVCTRVHTGWGRFMSSARNDSQ